MTDHLGLPLARDRDPTLVPACVVVRGAKSNVAKADRLLAILAVVALDGREGFYVGLRPCSSIKVRIHKLAMVFSSPPAVSDAVECIFQVVTEVDFIPQRIAKDDTHKLPVPGPLHILAPMAVSGARVMFESKWDPDGLTTWRPHDKQRIV